MRWLGGLLLLATIGVVAVFGFTPTSFGVSNGLPDASCRSVLGPIENASLYGADEVSFEIVDEWLLDVGYDDGGAVPREIAVAAYDRAHALCADARTARIGWMLLAGVVGLGLSGAATVAFRTPASKEPR